MPKNGVQVVSTEKTLQSSETTVTCSFSFLPYHLQTTPSSSRSFLTSPEHSRLSLLIHFQRLLLSSSSSQRRCSRSCRRRLPEDEFHKLADSTIHSLQEKLEEYGDNVQMDGFDVDYGNEVLTLKLGDLGTYVLNKQTPNRQIWLSSPVSGPSRFDWDKNAKGWVYRRTQANLSQVIESELEQLCGERIDLS